MGGHERTIRGVILAGVHRWNESPFERAMPRPLLPVAHTPLICYALRWLRDGGIKDITICANSMSYLVRSYLGDGQWLGVHTDYYEDPMPRGPAGCLRDVASFHSEEAIVAVDATLIPQIDLPALMAEHVRSEALVTVAVGRSGRNGSWPQKGLASTNAYVLERRALHDVRERGYRDIKEELIPHLYKSGQKVVPHMAGSPCPRVLGPTSYLHANEWVLRQLISRDTPPIGHRQAAGGLVHTTARVDRSANLIAPVLIGAETQIGERATIVGPAVLGAGCTIASKAVVSRSVVWDRCEVGENAVVDRSILASRAHVACGGSFSHAVCLQGEIKMRAPSEHLWT